MCYHREIVVYYVWQDRREYEYEHDRVRGSCKSYVNGLQRVAEKFVKNEV